MIPTLSIGHYCLAEVLECAVGEDTGFDRDHKAVSTAMVSILLRTSVKTSCSRSTRKTDGKTCLMDKLAEFLVPRTHPGQESLLDQAIRRELQRRTLSKVACNSHRTAATLPVPENLPKQPVH